MKKNPTPNTKQKHVSDKSPKELLSFHLVSGGRGERGGLLMQRTFHVSGYLGRVGYED